MTVSRRASPNSFCAALSIRVVRSGLPREGISPSAPPCSGAQRLEQRHEPLQAVGQRPRRDRQPLGGHPRGNAVHGAEAGTVLEQEACPEAGPVERPGEQPRHRGRRHFHGRRRALAGPAPARTADHALVGLDLDLDEGGFLGAVRRIGLPAPAADARIRRRVVLFGALIEPGPLGAAVAGRAALLAALVFRARLVLLLALAAVEPGFLTEE